MTIKNSIQTFLLTVTEIGMLVYWLFAVCVAVGLLNVPAEMMYSDYENPVIVSWNWSFLPIDIIFAVSGLMSRFLVHDLSKKKVLSTVSLTLMFCAGIMAISFWLIHGFYDVFWWGLNLWLIFLSLYVLGWRFFQEEA